MINNIKANIIIDGNYILSKLVFPLHKNNLLYGYLPEALENTFTKYRNMYGFNNTFIVSDSKVSSWRKKVYPDYKAKRVKDDSINWEFVYETYENFKNDIRRRYKKIYVLESPTIEGDDWISYLVNKYNERGFCNLIITNDNDIKQLIKMDLNMDYINIICNEMYDKEKLFLPKHHNLFLDKIVNETVQDVFNLNNNFDFLGFINGMKRRCEYSEIDASEILIKKIISGDSSDNIKSSYTSGKRGIGTKGSEKIFNIYKGDTSVDDYMNHDMLEDLAYIICEEKKAQGEFDKVLSNLEFNRKLIDLSLNRLPTNVVRAMDAEFENVLNSNKIN